MFTTKHDVMCLGGIMPGVCDCAMIKRIRDNEYERVAADMKAKYKAKYKKKYKKCKQGCCSDD